MRGWLDLIGINPENMRVREHAAEELSHYSSRTVDFEYNFPGTMGWKELYGLANRTDYDLTPAPGAFSGEDLTYFDQASEQPLPAARDRADLRRRPDVPDRCCSTPTTRRRRSTSTASRTRGCVLRLQPADGAVQGGGAAADEEAGTGGRGAGNSSISSRPRPAYLIEYDETGNIGKRYRRQDEIGTPFCFTVDYDTLEDKAVTVRDRDTTAQHRLPLAEVPAFLREKIA